MIALEDWFPVTPMGCRHVQPVAGDLVDLAYGRVRRVMADAKAAKTRIGQLIDAAPSPPTLRVLSVQGPLRVG